MRFLVLPLFDYFCFILIFLNNFGGYQAVLCFLNNFDLWVEIFLHLYTRSPFFSHRLRNFYKMFTCFNLDFKTDRSYKVPI